MVEPKHKVIQTLMLTLQPKQLKPIALRMFKLNLKVTLKLSFA